MLTEDKSFCAILMISIQFSFSIAVINISSWTVVSLLLLTFKLNKFPKELIKNGLTEDKSFELMFKIFIRFSFPIAVRTTSSCRLDNLTLPLNRSNVNDLTSTITTGSTKHILMSKSSFLNDLHLQS